MASTRKRKNQQNKQISQLDETLTDFVIRTSVNVNVCESENLEQQTNDQPNGCERVDNSACQNQVIANIIDDQFTGAVSSAVMTVENCMQDAILTAIHNLVFSRVEMALKSVTGSTGHGTNSEVQNLDRRDFFGIIRNIPLMSASSRFDLDNELDRNDETRNDEDFEDGDFPSLKPNYDRRAHAHHKILCLRKHIIMTIYDVF